MKQVLTKWFNEPIPQALVPERILANMALTVVDPKHPYAYKKASCWGRCAHAIAELRDTGQLHDGVSIAFYGRGANRADHAVLAENSVIELDIYYADRHGKQNVNDPYNHRGTVLDLQTHIFMPEFFEKYVSKVAPSSPAPGTSGRYAVI